MSKIKDRQQAFYKKLSTMPENTAIVQNIMQICDQSKSYYIGLQGDNYANDIRKRQDRIKQSTNSITTYYESMNFGNKSLIYTSYLCDHYRYIITRWRLSSHDLKIETGRYTKPSLPREMRLCETCYEVEDESHVIFKCQRYNAVREKYKNLLTQNNNICKFLNPDLNEVKETAKYLHDIEKLRDK